MRWPIALKGVAGLIALFALIALLGTVLRGPLETWGSRFIDRFGYWGMALGTFLADAFHFPVPPQFYMLAAIVGDRSPLGTLLAVSVGSLAGGALAFWVARKFGLRAARWLPGRDSRALEWISRNSGLAVVLGSCSPVPFSSLCIAAGLYRVIRGQRLVLFFLLRVPRLVLFYLVIRFGWASGLQ